MAYRVQLASFADVRSMSSVLNVAFKPLTQYKSLYDIQASDAGTPAEAAKDDEILGIWDFVLGKCVRDPQCWTYKAIEPSTGRVVGFSTWKAPAQIQARRRPQSLLQRISSAWRSVILFLRPYIPFAIRSYWYPILGRRYLEQRQWRDRLMTKLEPKHTTARDKAEGYWTLYILAIHPDYERKGIARQLLAPGLRMADEDDSAVFLTATETGAGLYEKLGFERLETLDLGDPDHGKWEEYVHRLERKSVRESASPGFLVQRASTVDIHPISNILNEAFKPLTMYKSLYDVQSSNAGTPAEAAKDKEIVSIWDSAMGAIAQDPGCWLFKTVEPSTGKIVGFSAWKAPAQIQTRWHHQTTLQRLAASWRNLTASVRSHAPYAIRALWYPTLGQRYLRQRQWRNELVGGLYDKHATHEDTADGYWILYMLAVHPEYERKGIAKQLLAPGMRMADEDNVAILLTSTETGWGLYEKLGFERLETLDLGDPDHRKWEEYVHRLERKTTRDSASEQ